MTNLQDIENAITNLNRDQLVAFRSWYQGFDSDGWDKDIALDAVSGKLNGLMQEALDAHQHGETKPL